MRKIILIKSLFLFFAVACTPARAPVPPGVIPEAPVLTRNEQIQGERARESMISQFPEDRDPARREYVRRILDRLIRETNSHPADWRLTILRDDRVANAAATRGNQIFVWTGLLSQLKSQDELAAVLGHEIAHILAGHVVPTSEEMLNQVVAEISGQVVGGVIGRGSPGSAGANIGGAITSEAVRGAIVNPYSRRLELEADHIGLFLMADAGFNPEAALDFWHRASNGSGKLAQFFSTHPSSSERLQRLRELMPKAKERAARGSFRY